MIEFKEFQKIPRLSRDCVITEKIDGTNASIYIPELPGEAGDRPFLVGSRTRWITPEVDNFGFARWAYEHAEELLRLGPGQHFGEWWGSGIQRGYGLQKGEKKFSLFNTGRWKTAASDAEGRESLPGCVGLVPQLYAGPFTQEAWERCLEELRTRGSFAAPGFMKPEGIVIYHVAGGYLFKKTLEGDEKPKGSKEQG